jgi:hypothetical protein
LVAFGGWRLDDNLPRRAIYAMLREPGSFVPSQVVH